MTNLRQKFTAGTSARRWIELGLVVAALAIGVGVAFASVTAAREWSNVRKLGNTYAELTGVQPSAASPLAAQREEMLKRINSSRLVAPPPMQLTGVLGDAAIFNGGMMVKAGQPAGDMMVKSVGANSVVVVKDGHEQTMYVFQPMPGAPGGRPGRGGPGGARPAAGGGAVKTQAMPADALPPGARRTGAPSPAPAPAPAPGAIQIAPGSSVQIQSNGSIITVTPGNHP